MKLRAILFDIDDTLFATTEFAGHARRHAVEAMVQEGLEVDADIASRELLDVVEEFSSNYGRHFDKLVVRLGAYLRPGIHPAVVIASGVRAYHETKARIEPGTAWDMSASAKTRLGDLPPSSRVTGVRFSAAARITWRPTWVDPVKNR